MRNENLKFINIPGWDIPKPYKDQEVRQILNRLLTMAPGESVRVTVPVERVYTLRWKVFRCIRRWELDATVFVRASQLYVKKLVE